MGKASYEKMPKHSQGPFSVHAVDGSNRKRKMDESRNKPSENEIRK